jgi:hypothetical protein
LDCGKFSKIGGYFRLFGLYFVVFVRSIKFQILVVFSKVTIMFRVRVKKIESNRDVDGNLGKRIELLEERELNPYVLRPQTDEAKMAQDIMQALQQQMPFLPQRQQLSTPKLILFLTEQEYDSLGIVFDVNQVYEVVLDNQAIRFRKV